MAATSNAPPLLVPYRAVGLVSTGLPLAIVSHGSETFVTASLGRTFQIYNCAKLRQVFVGPPLPSSITALGSHEDFTIVACGATVYVYRRDEQLTALSGEHEAPVRHLLTMGSTLISVCTKGLVVAWQLPDGSVLCRLHAGFTPTAILHPATYLNKVLLGAPSGKMQLWNLRSRARVHEFDRGWESPVTALEQSPALDVVAVGLFDGRILLHNLKYDSTILEVKHDDGDAVRSLAFRTDGTPWLVSGAASGMLHAWHLEKRARLALQPCAHEGGVATLVFMRGRSELLSAGTSDNALRMWSCDAHSGEMGLLRMRSGHAAPPSCVRFHDDELHIGGGPAGQAQILSAGADRTVRIMSIWSSQQDCELSQRREVKKRSMHEADPRARRLPPLLQLAASQRRERDWANLITCHVGSSTAYCWDTTTKCLAPHTLTARPAAPVTAVAISACGNFGFIGSEVGAIDKYNLQSGQHRAAVTLADRHVGAVRGLAAAADGRTLFSCGGDGTLRSWAPASLVLLRSVEVGCACSMLRHKRDSVLLALACDDRSIRVLDTVTCRPVRHFEGHTNTVTDVSWGYDARWLYSTALDCTLRIVDVPSGALIGWYSFEYAATSLCVSPGGEFLATSHVDSTAICVWAVRAAFQDVLVGEVASSRPTPLELPTALGGVGGDESDDEEGSESDDGEVEMEEAEEEETGPQAERRQALASLPQLDAQVHPQLFTLSKMPTSHINTLLNLDVINERNRPVEPPKKPELAPFFLPSLDGVERTFANPDKPSGLPDAAAALLAEGAAAEAEGAEDELGDGPKAKRARARRMQRQGLGAHSTLCALLAAAAPHLTVPEDEYLEVATQARTSAVSAVTEYLLGLGPSALDLEVRAVGEDSTGRTLSLMLGYVLFQLQTRRDFELGQALLQLLLRLHGEALAASPALLPALRLLRRHQQDGWEELQEPMHSNLCLLAFMSNCAN